MSLKKKLCTTLAISIAAAMLYSPVFAETNNQKPETKIEQKSECDRLSKKFKKELEERFETELKKEGIWYDMQIVNTLPEQLDNPIRKFYLEYDKNFTDKAKKSTEKAGVKALERTLRELELWTEVVERLKWLTKFEIIKSKGKKLELKDPLTEIKKPSQDEETKLEDSIDLLKQDIKDQRNAGNLREADRLKEELEILKDKLYQKRKFKLSFGFDLGLEGFDLGELDAKAYSKWKSRYFDGKLSYSTQKNKISLEMEKECQKDFFIKMENTYQERERSIENQIKKQNEFDTILGLTKKFQKNIDVSLSHAYNWDHNENVTSASLNKTFKKDVTLSFGSAYGWKDDNFSVNLGLTLRF